MEIQKQYNQSKKQNLKSEMIGHIDDILDVAEGIKSLDFFTIEIKVHNGELNANCTLKNKKKVY